MSGTTQSRSPDGGARRVALDPSAVFKPQALGPGRLPRTAKTNLQHYPDEFVFRFNRRRTRHAAFDTLLGIGARTTPAPYHVLIHKAAQYLSTFRATGPSCISLHLRMEAEFS